MASMTETTSNSQIETRPTANDVSATDTTRVFVSGLPPSFTSDQLKQHFTSKFKVTDAHVLADRRIGFVGFADTKSAQDATRHFNRSYIRMSKISVDLAKPVEVRRDKAGTAVPVSHKRGTITGDRGVKRKRARGDDGEVLRSDFANTAEQLPEESEEQDADVAAPTTNDGDWLRGRTTRTLDLVDAEDIQIRQDPEPGDATKTAASATRATQSDDKPDSETPNTIEVPNARLFVRNLAFTASEKDLRDLFTPYGKIPEIHLVKDGRKSTSKGTAFVQYAEASSAAASLQALDGTTFQGRILHVLPASDKRDHGLTEFDISKMPVKKQKAIRQKMEASKQNFSWNSLYMNPDAVLSSIAARLGVDKTDILDPTSSDAAVKQAHAETQLIKDTKSYLATAGVNVEAFQNRGRDEKCLLLKNFPYGTTEAELKALLEPHGMLQAFILPPAGTMALAQYIDPKSASNALKSLAYKNIKGSVLYLEKAPQGILDSPTTVLETKKVLEPETSVESTTVEATTTTVFIKNLNFTTTTTRLLEIARSLPGFVSARVKTRTDAKRPGQVLSMGFGFIELKSKAQAEAAVKALAGHQLDGHQLVAQLSSKSLDAGQETRNADKKRKKDANQTKIIIKNLPFQTTKKDIRALFSQYGELKMVRLPRKFDNTTRGFAFAEFVSPKEAENAMDALTNTHILGRRLVLQFAETDDVDPEEEIKAIERKVEQQSNRVHFNSLKGPGRKKFNLESARDDSFDA